MTEYTDKKPYLIDAVIGNSRFLASIGKTGRMYRLWWPNVDFPQHVDQLRTGLRLHEAESKIVWFDGDEEGWQHQNEYVARTNILKTRAVSTTVPIAVQTMSFAVPEKDILIRHYSFTNTGNRSIGFDFIHYSSLNIKESELYNTVEFVESHDALIHFRAGTFFCVSSANVCTKFQAGRTASNAWAAEPNGTLISLGTDGTLLWTFRQINPGESVDIPIFITAGPSQHAVLNLLEEVRQVGMQGWVKQTTHYWHDFLVRANPCLSKEPRLIELYERSLLAMKLMTDEQTGAIIAAPEFDERYSRCGGYGYCWGRDAAFITTALDSAGLYDLSTHFYEWALTAQDSNGAWQQRHYHDGRLAPSWGIQLDEGGSIIWGMWQHVKALQQYRSKDETRFFIDRIKPAVYAGATFLMNQIDPGTGLPLPSIDLWEERKAEHTYTAATVIAGLSAAAEFARYTGDADTALPWLDMALMIRKSILLRCWNEQEKVFYRGLKLYVNREQAEQAGSQGKQIDKQKRAKGYTDYILTHDPIVDVSMIGISVPFGIIPVDHPYARDTASAIEKRLTDPHIGGIRRYENDSYIGGNPWILTTLWLAQYHILNGEFTEAKKAIDWAAEHQTTCGLLPEQVDRTSGETAWVVPLTWSHAMFVLAIQQYGQATL